MKQPDWLILLIGPLATLVMNVIRYNTNKTVFAATQFSAKQTRPGQR